MSQVICTKNPKAVLNRYKDELQTEFSYSWRIPKEGDLQNIPNFRPVSNMSSLSKLFEMCVLHSLMALHDYQELLGLVLLLVTLQYIGVNLHNPRIL